MATNNAINTSIPRPSFFASLSSSQTGVTGNYNDYTIVFDTTLWNYTGCYSTSTGMFTCALAGNYSMTLNLMLTNLNSNNSNGSIFFYPTAPGGLYLWGGTINFGKVFDANTNCCISYSTNAYLNVGDQYHTLLTIGGNTAGDNVGLYTAGPNQPGCYWSCVYLGI